MRHFGHPEGVAVGAHFRTRLDLLRAGVHGVLQAGISGSAADGADAIIYSDAYEDNVDLGHTIYYPGHGGRSRASGKQVAHQQLTAGTRALLTSLQTGLPVRVIRRVETDTGPQYRYDGLYRVTDLQETVGLSGYGILLFTFRQLPS